MPNPSVKDALIEADRALENISLGLLQLDQIKDTLSVLTPGPKVIDITARMNAQYTALEKIVVPLKDTIKASALEGDQTIRGIKYQATIQKIVKTILDGPAVKKYLGRDIFRFQKERSEKQLSFSIRE